MLRHCPTVKDALIIETGGPGGEAIPLGACLHIYLAGSSLRRLVASHRKTAKKC
jgi:hypothetical protein